MAGIKRTNVLVYENRKEGNGAHEPSEGTEQHGLGGAGFVLFKQPAFPLGPAESRPVPAPAAGGGAAAAGGRGSEGEGRGRKGMPPLNRLGRKSTEQSTENREQRTEFRVQI